MFQIREERPLPTGTNIIVTPSKRGYCSRPKNIMSHLFLYLLSKHFTMSSFIDEHFHKISPRRKSERRGSPVLPLHRKQRARSKCNHKAYCGVSGSPVDPNRPRRLSVYVVRARRRSLRRLPLVLLALPMRRHAIRHGGRARWEDGPHDPRPMRKRRRPETHPRRDRVPVRNGKTANATHTASGRIAMAVLQNPRACVAEELKEVLAQCKDRMATPVEAFKEGWATSSRRSRVLPHETSTKKNIVDC